jgi:chromosome segregation ATPase
MEKTRKNDHMVQLCIILAFFCLGMAVLSVLMWFGKKKAAHEMAEHALSLEHLADENEILNQEITKYKDSYESLVEVNTKLEQELNEYKSLYESLLEEKQKTEQDAKEAEEKAKQRAADYQNSFNTLVESMLDEGALTENLGNLIIKVWHNAILNTEDEETNKFTKVNGVFVTDFNDALDALFADAEFRKEYLSLSTTQKQIKDEMKEMLNPPEGLDSAFKALENLYNSYISFSNIVLNCSGSLESFSNEFGKADADMIQKYNAAELYLK